MSLADTILQKGTALPYKDVPVPELDMPELPVIRVRCLTAGENQRYQLGFFMQLPDGSLRAKPYDEWDASARLLVLACTNPADGTQLFTDADIPRLKVLRSDVAERLKDTAETVSKLSATLQEIRAFFSQAQTASKPTA